MTGAVLKDPAAAGLTKTTVACSGTRASALTARPPRAQLESGGGFALPTLASGQFFEITVGANVTASSGSVANTATVTAPGGTTDNVAGNNTATDTDTVNSTGSISGTVYNDLNGNGSLDGGEVGKAGVTVFIDTNNNGVLNGGETSTSTDGSGNYSFANLTVATYRITYVIPSGWANTGTRPLLVTVSAGANSAGNNFFTQERDASISGHVYNDTNGNGSLDGGELGIGGVTVTLTGGTPTVGTLTTTTAGDGSYSFTGLQAGSYSVDYTIPSGFINTGAKPLSFTLTAGQAATAKDFFAQAISKSLLLTKSVAESTYNAVGNTLHYTYTIQNTGNVTLAGPFTVSDDHIGTPLGTAFVCGSGPLAPNATTGCSATYTISQPDLDAGTVTNHATASGNSVTSNTASATSTAVQTRTLLLTKPITASDPTTRSATRSTTPTPSRTPATSPWPARSPCPMTTSARRSARPSCDTDRPPERDDGLQRDLHDQPARPRRGLGHQPRHGDRQRGHLEHRDRHLERAPDPHPAAD